jgi:hypothetical protein
MIENLFEIRVPIFFTELMITTAMKAAIKPYSIAVAAVSSCQNRLNIWSGFLIMGLIWAGTG